MSSSPILAVRPRIRPADRGALPGRVLIGAAAIAWLALLWLTLAGHHHSSGAYASGTPPVGALSWTWVSGWLLMVVAMMWPLLVPTIDRVSRSAYPRWRFALTSLTVLTSTVLWCALGFTAALLAGLAGVPVGSLWWQLSFLLIAAVAWRSAARSRLLWRCSKLPPLAPGGRRGVITAITAGAVSWQRCALLCGPLMIAMVVGHHPLVMIPASLSVWWEAWHPRAWRDRVPLALIGLAGLGALGGGLLS